MKVTSETARASIKRPQLLTLGGCNFSDQESNRQFPVDIAENGIVFVLRKILRTERRKGEKGRENCGGHRLIHIFSLIRGSGCYSNISDSINTSACLLVNRL
ncbi:hypothetical protein O6P43_008274 [Quillaja saponaria]|uniref:Uncharacterized protein n=1 Tax=Quillaja saponaria TaxID=32244 RepID=A0AAD7M4W4_QUISA|nr:hypothetical protein O6P43_008274 [Quillaja saponaria]